MKINLITKEQYKKLLNVQKKYPVFTFQNNGYEYPDFGEMTEEQKSDLNEVIKILKNSIVGFLEFNHFKILKNGDMGLRFQYNYGAEDKTRYFEGVGYIKINELLNGFNN